MCGVAQGFLTHNPAAFVEIDDIFDCFRYPLRDIWNRLNARLSRHTLSTELIFIRFALPQNDFDTCIRRRNVVIWLKRNLSFHLQCFLQRLCTCFCTFYCQSNTQNVPGQQRFVFCTKSWFFLPPEHVKHGVFSIYAIIAQPDRALASDNCDMAGFRLVLVRYSVICAHRNAVVNGSQTTNWPLLEIDYFTRLKYAVTAFFIYKRS